MTRLDGIGVEVVDDVAGLLRRAPAWEDLLLRQPRPSHTASPAWVISHLEHAEAAVTGWRCLVAWSGARVVGVLPLVRAPFPSWNARLPRSVRRTPRLRVPCSFQTNEGDPLLDPEHPEPVLHAMLSALARLEPGRLSVEFGAMRPESPTLRALAQRRRGVAVLEEHDCDGRFLRVHGSYAETLGHVGDNMRRNLRKAHNRIRQVPGARFRILRGRDADPALVDAFLALEASGWKGRSGSAILARPAAVAFYRAFTTRLATAGRLEWHVFEAEGAWRAAHLGVRIGRRLALHRIAYDESMARLGPGNLIFDHLIHHVADAGDTDLVDCMTDMPWHDRWAMGRYPYQRAHLYPLRPLPLLLGYAPSRVRGLVLHSAVAPLLKRFRHYGPLSRAEAEPTEGEAAEAEPPAAVAVDVQSSPRRAGPAGACAGARHPRR